MKDNRKTIQISKGLHYHLKIFAARMGKTMSELIEGTMAEVTSYDEDFYRKKVGDRITEATLTGDTETLNRIAVELHMSEMED